MIVVGFYYDSTRKLRSYGVPGGPGRSYEVLGGPRKTGGLAGWLGVGLAYGWLMVGLWQACFSSSAFIWKHFRLLPGLWAYWA